MECIACDRPGLARGLCSSHYARWWRTKRVRAEDPIGGVPANERFWTKVDQTAGPDACWPWLGSRSRGYGRFSIGRQELKAHRYTLFGLINRPEAVLHACDNPPCCNPQHLWIGSRRENNADRAKKGRSATGERMAHAKLSQGRAEEIRHRYAQGGVSQQRIADEMGISQALVSQVVHERVWRR